MTDEVLLKEDGNVLIVTINRPQRKNAVNMAVAEGIAAAIDLLDSTDSLAAAVLTGANDTFCTGMDLKAFLQGERPVLEGRGFAGITQHTSSKPLIAAVEGYAIAGGFEIALSCDLIVASRDAVFSVPEVKRGLTASGGAMFRLPRRIPFHVAMELILTGEPCTAVRAAELGLVNRIVEPGTALDAAAALGKLVADNGPMAVAAAKAVVLESQDWPLSEAFDRQRKWTDKVRSSADAKEGALAFTEKRSPVWQNR